MNLQKVLISGIIIGVISFFLGWLIWGILLADMLTMEGMSSVMRPEADMIMWAMIVSNLVWGIFLAYVFDLGNINDMQKGAMVGAMLSILIVAAYDFGLYSMTTMYTLSDVVKDIVVNTVFMAILGGILGWWNGRK